MAYKTILFEKQDTIGMLTLNRPEMLNAASVELIEELRDCFAKLYNDFQTRVVIIRGAGRAFCSGLDLKEGFKAPSKSEFGEIQYRYHKVQQAFADVIVRMRRVPQPIIGAIRGPAVGGGFSLALACDLRIAGKSARFNAGYILIGLSGTDLGSSYFLPRIIGFSQAAEYLLTGRFLDAATAERFGLVSRVVADDQVDAAALELANEMLQNSPLGLRMTKEVMNFNIDAPSLESALHLENRTQLMLSLTEDGEEGAQAFLEKRTPLYRDR
ncbi:MAG TPA: enoyl-CoA hydratase/isomerase family protein [Dehalococcoidia bacterium]|nr:enoyl-CoA hydratase/isomerase family protein [Dehalococcoidia bacterium]